MQWWWQMLSAGEGPGATLYQWGVLRALSLSSCSHRRRCGGRGGQAAGRICSILSPGVGWAAFAFP